MSQIAEWVASSGLGGAVALLIRAGARWLNKRNAAKRVHESANKVGGPEYGTIGWAWTQLNDRITREVEDLEDRVGKAHSKAHAVEKTQNRHGERLAALEQHSFGESRMDSGEQERLDFAREREEWDRRQVPEVKTEPDPMPAFGPPSRSRRSRP